jgi:UDP-glucose 4-epimerase
MKTCIVTGGCGFIGSHLVEKLLSDNNKVVIIDDLSTGHIQNIKHLIKNKNLKLINKSILDPSIKKYFKKVEIVYHLAGQSDIVPSIENPTLYYDVNSTGTLKILNYVRDNRIKTYVYAASSSCYGIPKKYPTSEIAEINPRYPYALTKYFGEKLSLHWSKLYDFNCVSLRLFNVFGPRVRTTGHYGAVFGVFLSQLANKKPLTVVGDGEQKRDFTFVDDVVDAFVLAGKSKKSGVFNVGTSKPITINKVVKILKVKKIISLPTRPGEPFQTNADTRKIKKELKWFPKVKFEDGLKIMLKDIKKWKKAPLWNKHKIDIATKKWFKHVK